MALGEDICYLRICKDELIYVDKGNGLDMWDNCAVRMRSTESCVKTF